MATSLVAYREWLGPYRGVFFLVAALLLGRAHYLYWKRQRKTARWVTTVTLWVSTALMLTMMGVFYVYRNPMFF